MKFKKRKKRTIRRDYSPSIAEINYANDFCKEHKISVKQFEEITKKEN